MFKEVLYRSDYLIISHDQDNGFLYMKWLPDVLQLSEEEFKEQMMQFLEAQHKTGVKKIVVDALQAVYPLTEDIGKWIIEVITKGLIEGGVNKIAYLYPSDYLTKLGLESFIGDAYLKAKDIKRKVFDDVNEAIDWLVSD